jgi:hypothetical protein
LEDEAELLTGMSLPAGVVLLGIDAYGADLRVAGVRRRLCFEAAPLDMAAIGGYLAAALAALS